MTSGTRKLDSAICTIASKNYLAHVRALAESFRRFHPEVPVYFLLVDRPDGYYDPRGEPFISVPLDDLPIENLPAFCFQYTILELNTAVKPFLLEHLFARGGYDRILYFDPDIKFYAPVTPLFDALEQSLVVLLPHLTEPLRDEARPSELDILRSGAYNLGFVGLSRSPTTERLLRWWQDKLRRYCLADVSQGLFTDQRWMDLAPGMFEGVRVIRDPGCDVAYWNLQHRRLECSDAEYVVNGEALRFFHFSGFDPDSPETVSKHQDRYRLHDLPCLPELFGEYRDDLLRHGYEQVKRWPYSLGRFDDGTRIPEVVREIYRELGVQAERFDDPFRTDKPDSFLTWLNEPAEGTGDREPVLTRLALEIYRRRSDLQAAFPHLGSDDRVRYTKWVAGTGRAQHDLDQTFIEALKNPPAVAAQAARTHEAQRGAPTADSGRVRMVTALARAGLGKAARKMLGRRASERIRDWMMWGRATTVTPPPPAPSRIAGRAPERGLSGSFGINIVGSLCSESGVGEGVRSGIRGLLAAQVPVAGTRVDYAAPQRTQDDSCPQLPSGNPHAANLFWVNADQTPQVLSMLGADFLEGKFNIGYWAWELERFPQEWTDRFAYLDEIWTPSSFCQDAISRAAPVPVLVMPHSVEVTDIEPIPPDVLDLPDDHYVFLFIYDYFSFAERKNPLAVVEAFRRAFPRESKVHLVLKGTDGSGDPSYHDRLKRACAGAPITILARYLDRGVLNGLLQRCDCYVSLHRSEGFGLTIAEAMYLGKPVIATAYAGNVDFTRPDNAYLVRYDLVEIERDHGPYKQGWLWAEPDVDDAAQMMRHVFDKREEAAQVAARGMQHIRRHYSHAAVGQRMKERLEVVLGDLAEVRSAGPDDEPGAGAQGARDPASATAIGESTAPGQSDALWALEYNWDGLARDDPLWAILADPQKRHGRWHLDEFLRTGKEMATRFIELVNSTGIEWRRGVALDFGCGVGRITQGLSECFDRVVGVDISPQMIELARELDQRADKLAYVLSRSPNLPFRNESFDFVCSHIVLQHMKPELALGYIAEFLRVLRRQGVALFDALYECTVWEGETCSRTPVETELGTFFVDMNLVPVEEVVKTVAAGNGKVVKMHPCAQVEDQLRGYFYVVQKQ